MFVVILIIGLIFVTKADILNAEKDFLLFLSRIPSEIIDRQKKN